MVDSYFPRTLTEALEIRNNGQVIPFAGGTDLMVRKRKWSGTLPGFDRPVLFLGGIETLKGIHSEAGVLTIGAGATLTSLLQAESVPEMLKRAVRQMASPAIRNMGTLGGNLVNASPAADSLPPLYALGAWVVLQNLNGCRELPIADFIQGPGKTGLAPDELLVKVKIPIKAYSMAYYKKVGTRKADALSKVSFAGLARVVDGQLEDLRIALGAVAPRVVRSPEIEAGMIGRSVRTIPEWVEKVKKQYEPLLQPIDDQRSSAVYRKKVSLRLIEDFLRSLSLNRKELDEDESNY